MILDSVASGHDQESVLIDARWRGYTGIGRVTELVLRGLPSNGSDRRWLVWTRKDDDVTGLPGQRLVRTGHAPTNWLAQRDRRAIPAANAYLWLHAVRPLAARGGAVLVHDVIPATRYPAPARQLWRAFLRRSVAWADRVLVYSMATQDKVEDVLGVPSQRIERVTMTIDTRLTDRVRQQRHPDAPSSGHLLYVGQLKAHKNVHRAIEAFALSRAGRAGREFVLVGGLAEEQRPLREYACKLGVRARFVVRCPEDELVSLYAGSAAVIQPSLEEGFGLTVLEALVAGIPVACSEIAAHKEAARGLATMFDPMDPSAIADAIDVTISASVPRPPSVPTPAEFAGELLHKAGLV